MKFKEGDRVLIKNINSFVLDVGGAISGIGIVLRIKSKGYPVVAQFGQLSYGFNHGDLLPASKLGKYLYGIDAESQNVVESSQENL